MAAKIILSPEISELVEDLLQIDNIFFKSEENTKKAEELLTKILSMLPCGVIGFTFNGRIFLKTFVVESLPELEKFTLLLMEEEQPKESKQE